MEKILIIDNCTHCCNYIFDEPSVKDRWGKDWCQVLNRELKNTDIIPEDCPLPDAKAKKEEEITYKRPPIGIIPKDIYYRNVKKERFIEVCEAISKYYNAGLPILIEWIEEFNELVEYVKSLDTQKYEN